MGLGVSPLVGKRDSFGRSLALASISNKVELHTLVEEDEEDEDEDHADEPPVVREPDED